MSVVGILLHLSRAIIHAHNNAKVRNLMNAPPPEIRRDMSRHGSPDTPEKRPGAIHTGGR
ncbi:hypothetical protein RFM26_07525 [Mesorhizobium sp. VK23B]|uniref:Uncharacterized protein n=1 Tax=Mesorhizobium dulcispinae TaxID=3072316 RepID=A0ABU4XD13_9HYPH|nr:MULTISPECIES: hypothetical protein [unclassified Mesorhizobium]MDX8465533.1 hypothetical protein [Mesorhizobium sp. VK23B]MDX8471665.1 hypothetical protein [Mesorhizobium sp. VK23A]MDX8518919.1 hypothetical protein [Mesorhizobium sp. VK23D]